MCGRYNIEFDENDEIDQIIRQVDERVKKHAVQEGYEMKLGEIFPTNIAPILRSVDQKIEADLSCWGFPNFNKKGVIINARGESVKEKPMFRSSMLARRCIIPSTGFYEWDKEKRKYFIRRQDSNALYMAGIYNYYNEESRFVILTTAANDSMEVIHHRMPMILEKNEMEDWLFDDRKANLILQQTMPQLNLELVKEPYEQLRLF